MGRPLRKANLALRRPTPDIAGMKELLATALPRLVLPPDAGISGLCTKIDLLRVDVEIASDLFPQAHEDIVTRLKALDAAYTEVAKHLPVLRNNRDHLARLLPDAGMVAIPQFIRLSMAVEIGDRVMRALSDLGSMHEWVPPAAQLPTPRTAWPDYLDRMIAEFQEIMEPYNPRMSWGVSRHGLLTKYLTTIIPYITGETPTGETIHTTHKRMARRG